MQLGKQIKKYQSIFKYSQEQLAAKIFVSRQTISNWETDKSYPDVQSLLLLSHIFGISLDELVKGDVQIMKDELRDNGNKRKINYYSWVMLLSFLMAAISLGPILLANRLILLGLPFLLLMPALYCGIRVEMLKKASDLKTYSEILAFIQGKSTDEVKKDRNRISVFFE